ncbi:hypothetical protein EMIHUDRAFT_119894 [Emiliania huxleyi CCMP1516]|uniref:Uncharacterized protein n=2 Tax=Emiliania huxleyi TaxID=2903 RepID=A0A0D3IPX5_EMIH1|nr:hypothetical protein EMIHUDRAFT_119894 [Emiliania huxleyi CCMP1516]EOD13310.1 hypothetical protein EMIHUDRAFT_119894 [Emiliania huxleyi CCMP1516]|eukprot:XP_005765739.1 hypothetical protein EMIHUDRAFT_119894 [Emiliania huxleyi CCMP1516]
MAKSSTSPKPGSPTSMTITKNGKNYKKFVKYLSKELKANGKAFDFTIAGAKWASQEEGHEFKLGGISTGALSNLLPTASIGRLGASQHDPPAPASNAPSFSVVSSVADSVFGGGASRRARIAEVLNIICQEIGTISPLGAAGRLHGGHAASGWNGIYLASESPGPARVFREKGGT